MTSASPAPILTSAEADRRTALLADLERVLTSCGVDCVLARTRRIVLREGPGRIAPSGPTDPQLRIFAAAGQDVVTTDGRAYYFASGRQFPVGDLASAAIAFVPLPR
jgi:hypothetical protein